MRTSQFKRYVKRILRQGKDLLKLKNILGSLVNGERLEDKYRDHVLVGQYKGTRECHLKPDWFLIYEITESEIILIRTGSHSELFE
ncbi:MAG: type II toxin-antitoxin system YafQ family toxin [Chloroflexota bacterium]|nr:type II toxin-antitoxin system YafQ family toxin [Chloroflexota bacterium]